MYAVILLYIIYIIVYINRLLGAKCFGCIKIEALHARTPMFVTQLVFDSVRLVAALSVFNVKADLWLILG